LGVVEGADDGVDAGGEVVYAVSELVVTGERGSFVGEASACAAVLFGGMRLRWRGAAACLSR